MQSPLTNEPLFIERDAMVDIFASLDEATRRQRILILSGPRGCGKNTLLDTWVRKKITACRAEQVLYVTLPRIESTIPAAWALFSQLWAQLEDLLRPEYARLNSSERIIKQFTKRNLDWLRIEVQKAINVHNIRTLVIGKAHRLDLSATIDLLEMRSFWSHEQGQKPRFSLIIADRYGEDGKDSDFLRTFKKRDEIAGAWTQLQMNYVQPNEFARILSTLFRRQLNIRFKSDVDVDAEATEAYQLTGGEWRLLADYVDALDVTLGGSATQKRDLDHAMLQQAKKRFRANTAHRPRPSEPVGLPNDFVALVSSLVTVSLNARFDEKLDREAVAAEWFKATTGEWLALQQLVTCVNDVLCETTSESEGSALPRVLDEQKLRESHRRFNQRKQDATPTA